MIFHQSKSRFLIIAFIFFWQSCALLYPEAIHALRPTAFGGRSPDYSGCDPFVRKTADDSAVMRRFIHSAVDDTLEMVNRDGTWLTETLRHTQVPGRRLQSDRIAPDASTREGDPSEVTLLEVIQSNLEVVKEIISEEVLAGERVKPVAFVLMHIEKVVMIAAEKVQDEREKKELSSLVKNISQLKAASRLYSDQCALLRNYQYFRSGDLESDLIAFTGSPKHSFDDRLGVALMVLFANSTCGGVVTLFSDSSGQVEKRRQSIGKALIDTLIDIEVFKGSDGLEAANLDLSQRFLDAKKCDEVKAICEILFIFDMTKVLDLDYLIMLEQQEAIADKIIEVSSGIAAGEHEALSRLAPILVRLDPHRALEVIESDDPALLVYPLMLNLGSALEVGAISPPQKAQEFSRRLAQKETSSRWPAITPGDIDEYTRYPSHRAVCDALEENVGALLSNSAITGAFNACYPNQSLSEAVSRATERMNQLPRFLFLPRYMIEWSLPDQPIAIPMGHGQTISQPITVREMTAMANLKPTDRVLEIGTGSGYQAAILAGLAREVHTVEVYLDLAMRADDTCNNLGITNIKFWVGDGSQGLPGEAGREPFDIIIITAGAPHVPEQLKQQLSRDGGRMLIPIQSPHDPQVYDLVLIVRNQDKFSAVNLGRTRWVPLVGRGGYREVASPAMILGPPRLLEELLSIPPTPGAADYPSPLDHAGTTLSQV